MSQESPGENLSSRKWMTVDQTARYLQIHKVSVYKAIQRGQLPYIKKPGFGIKVDRVRLDELLEREEHIPPTGARVVVDRRRKARADEHGGA